jgi:hypothetical protein
LRLTKKVNDSLNNKINELSVNQKILSDLISLKELTITNKCVCNNSLLESKLDNLELSFKNYLDRYFPIDFNAIYNKIDNIKLTTSSLNEIKQIITNNNNELISKLSIAKEETETTANNETDNNIEIVTSPKEELPVKPVVSSDSSSEKEPTKEEIESKKQLEELNKFKDEVRKLDLTEIEKENLNETKNKEEVELLQTKINERLAILEQEKKDQIAKEAKELDDLKKGIDLSNATTDEKSLLDLAKNKEEVEKVRNQISEREKKEQEDKLKLEEEEVNKLKSIKLSLNEIMHNVFDKYSAIYNNPNATFHKSIYDRWYLDVSDPNKKSQQHYLLIMSNGM